MYYKYLIENGNSYQAKRCLCLLNLIPLVSILLGLILVVYLEHVNIGLAMTSIAFMFFLIFFAKNSRVQIFPNEKLIQLDPDRYKNGPYAYSFSELHVLELETLYLMRIPLNTTLYAVFHHEHTYQRRAIAMAFDARKMYSLKNELEILIRK